MVPTTFRTQKRGGKGLIGSELKEEDQIEQLLSADTHDNILFFTDRGKVYQTKVYEIPVASRTAKGKSIMNFLEIPAADRVRAVVTYPQSLTDGYLVMATSGGVIKKTPIADFANVRCTGIIAISLRSGDVLKWAKFSSGNCSIIITTTHGQAIRFKEKDVRPMGRTASGVTAIRLKKHDSVAGLGIIEGEGQKSLLRQGYGGQTKVSARGGSSSGGKSQNLLVIMENGYGKQTPLKEYKTQRRGGSGIKTANVTEKTGRVMASSIVDNTFEELLAFSAKGQAIKTLLKDVRTLGRSTQGVKIMNLEKGDKLIGIVCL
jgi:DNA gyrase subunit A